MADVKPLINASGQIRPVHAGETMPVANGGTGATTASAARTGLDVYSKGEVDTAVGAAGTIANDSITYAKMQNVSATSRVIGRATAGAGDPEELTLSQVLDLIGSAAQGDVLYRGSSAWARLGAGSSGQVLQTNGAASNPSWVTPSGGSVTTSGPTKLTILQRTTTQVITTNTWTAVSWDTTAVQDDVGAFSSGSPTLWTVPSGYTKMRVLAYTVWFNNGAGSARSTRLDKNGTTTIEADMRSAINEAGAHMQTRWMTVTPGDTYQILVLHAVGVNLNFATTGGFGSPAYVQVEWAP